MSAFAVVLAYATQAGLLSAAVLGAFLLGRRLCFIVPSLAAVCALLPFLSSIARFVALHVLARAGGGDANLVSYVPVSGARYLAVALVTLWLGRLLWLDGVPTRRRLAALAGGACIAVTPWALDPLSDRVYVANVELRNRWETLLSTRAAPRWVEGRRGELPGRFSIGLTSDGLYSRAWACGVDSSARAVTCPFGPGAPGPPPSWRIIPSEAVPGNFSPRKIRMPPLPSPHGFAGAGRTPSWVSGR